MKSQAAKLPAVQPTLDKAEHALPQSETDRPSRLFPWLYKDNGKWKLRYYDRVDT